MLIDLHCHTKKVKKGDGNGRNVTPELFRTKIELADIKIVAITNHNAFDKTQYQILQDAVRDICLVWPGVEIDVKGTANKDRFHLIVIANPENVELFTKCVDKLFEGQDLDKCVLSLDDVCKAFKKCDAIFVPHFHNKRPAISNDDRQRLIKLVGDEYRVFIEPRDHRTLGVLANNQFNVMLGSDVQDWSTYEKCTFSELRLPVGSFSEMLLLAKRDSSIVKTLLNKKDPLVLTARPHKTAEFKVNIYPDVNIIFGQKGTGKTEILKSLYDDMICEGKSCKKYIASERSEDFSGLLSIKNMDIDYAKLGIELCESDFVTIKNWTDRIPEAFTNYVSWISTRGNSNNKLRMKITEAVHYSNIKGKDYNTHKKDFKNIATIKKEIGEMPLEQYLQSEKKEVLLELIEELREGIHSKRTDDLIEEEATKLVNFSIDDIKRLADRNSDTVSRPSSAGLERFSENRINLYVAVCRILDAIDWGQSNEKTLIGSLEDKGSIYVNTKYRMLCSDSKRDEYSGTKITQLREIINVLKEVKEKCFTHDVATLVESFNALCEDNGIFSVKQFLGISKQIVREDGEEYIPSNGEKGILLLQQVLKEDADAYFLDEPELGMGNSYIDTEIRPLISGLARQRKYVVVATHNANIAVRTLPYTSIYRTHENGIYKTYIGNPFDDKLVFINDKSVIKSWTEESMHTLEGSKEAFYERKDIYESKDNKC